MAVCVQLCFCLAANQNSSESDPLEILDMSSSMLSLSEPTALYGGGAVGCGLDDGLVTLAGEGVEAGDSSSTAGDDTVIEGAWPTIFGVGGVGGVTGGATADGEPGARTSPRLKVFT